MALNIPSAEADSLARQLAAITGEPLAVAVTRALAERIQRCRPRTSTRRLALREIRERVSTLPVLDERSEDQILGYGPHGSFDPW